MPNLYAPMQKPCKSIGHCQRLIIIKKKLAFALFRPIPFRNIKVLRDSYNFEIFILTINSATWQMSSTVANLILAFQIICCNFL